MRTIDCGSGVENNFRGMRRGSGPDPFPFLNRSKATEVSSPPMRPDRQYFMSSMAQQYGRRLRRFLSTRLRNASDVPDLAQEVFLRLMRVQDFDNIRSPEAYLFTVASHVIHQHTLRESSAPIERDLAGAFVELQTRSHDDPEVYAQIEQQMEGLQVVLRELPPRVAATLVLARLQGTFARRDCL